ncbi:flagellar export chaperone FliS [Candidatus Nitrospira inopinata]|jgi:flagellar protein FliS|uniref:Flagellar secretion chaperone FliS n=1 Tax=Candidatus Nitrospira inopinata TaxID=1715989 RepID=A0A0S4KXN8_9BACT|nr:flagellar export chaperone FliS [Candidatus Nitrospira inopinata]CUQ67243.1 Flagellin-specific chaperone FliS [Candidatus Nitrospira inopinata]
MIAQCANRYRQTQVMTSSRVQIVVLLYDAAIQSIELARQAIETGNIADKGRFLGRAISIVGELDCALDYERGGEIASLLHRLYEYVLSELIEANVRNEGRRLEGALRCLNVLREGWRGAAVQEHAPLALTR